MRMIFHGGREIFKECMNLRLESRPQDLSRVIRFSLLNGTGQDRYGFMIRKELISLLEDVVSLDNFSIFKF